MLSRRKNQAVKKRLLEEVAKLDDFEDATGVVHALTSYNTPGAAVHLYDYACEHQNRALVRGGIVDKAVTCLACVGLMTMGMVTVSPAERDVLETQLRARHNLRKDKERASVERAAVRAKVEAEEWARGAPERARIALEQKEQAAVQWGKDVRKRAKHERARAWRDLYGVVHAFFPTQAPWTICNEIRGSIRWDDAGKEIPNDDFTERVTTCVGCKALLALPLEES